MERAFFGLEDIAVKAQPLGKDHIESFTIVELSRTDHGHPQLPLAGRRPTTNHPDSGQDIGLREAGKASDIYKHPACALLHGLAEALVYFVYGLRKGPRPV